MIAFRFVSIALTTLAFSHGASAQFGRVASQPRAALAIPPKGALDKLPVREVTVFKDGHAFILQEGTLPVEADGNITLDNLPTPVVGTFWPYASGVDLTSVVAGREPLTIQRTAQSVRDLLKANVGADVTIIETPERRYDAKILGVPQAPPDEIALIAPDDPNPRPREGEVILLQTAEGVRVAPINSIQNLIFKTAPRTLTGSDEFRNRLRLKLNWKGAPRATATVGTVYLQKGIRWIPSYRIALDGRGRARIKMQATLVNDLLDLKNATANLVIGVPSFAFKENIDPISLQETFARLSPLFDPNSRSAGAFSNAIQSQVGGASYNLNNNNRNSTGAATSDAAGIDVGGGANEDFYVFSAKNISLAKGERMAFPLAEYELPYEDIYTLETPAAPPLDLYRSFNYEQQNTVTTGLVKPNVMHKIRLTNNSKQPLTTAPALIESDGRLLAQTLMTYTATGGRSDLDLAPAVDVTAKRSEAELKRTPNALTWNGNSFSRVDVTGKITVTSYRNEPVTLEITRQFVGSVDRAANEGVIKKLGAGDDDNPTQGGNYPAWWRYVNNDYWGQVNGLSSVTWKIVVPAKKSVELRYEYHYFWR